jgi:hypothetical protein
MSLEIKLIIKKENYEKNYIKHFFNALLWF